MFKLSYGTINNRLFIQALAKISMASGGSVKTSYTIGKIEIRVNKEVEEARKLYMDIVKKHSFLDESGKPKTVTNPDTGGEDFSLDPAKQDEFMKAIESLQEIEFEIHQSKIPLNELGFAQLSGRELAALEPMLIQMEVLNGSESAAS